jgi:hypothetical protein
MKPDWKSVVVAAPEDERILKGDGWALDLKPGWKLIVGGRKGDFTLSFAP